jgi:hypothetical protein
MMARKGKAYPALWRRLWRVIIAAALLAGLALFLRPWLDDNPQHNPFAPLDLNDPGGLATPYKLLQMRRSAENCRAVLARSQIAHHVLEPMTSAAEPANLDLNSGESPEPCARPDRVRLDRYPFSPNRPVTTCRVSAGLALWRRTAVDLAAQELFGSEVTEIQHLGSFSCRRLYGRGDGAWSEHASGNAIDIAGSVLADGTRISVLGHWDEGGAKAAFLRRVRDGACDYFGTVLSPDYNAAHRDHFHFDMMERYSGVCR